MSTYCLPRVTSKHCIINWHEHVRVLSWQRSIVETAIRDVWQYMHAPNCQVNVHWRDRHLSPDSHNAAGVYDPNKGTITIAWQNVLDQNPGYSKPNAALYQVAAHEMVHRVQDLLWPHLVGTSTNSAEYMYCEDQAMYISLRLTRWRYPGVHLHCKTNGKVYDTQDMEEDMRKLNLNADTHQHEFADTSVVEDLVPPEYRGNTSSYTPANPPIQRVRRRVAPDEMEGISELPLVITVFLVGAAVILGLLYVGISYVRWYGL